VTRPDERTGPEVFREVPRLPEGLDVDGPDSVVELGVIGVVLCGLNKSEGLVTI
jgi:hypothetical protein